jgi:hypothetical protein
MTQPLTDLHAEAERVITAIEADRVAARLAGGLAVARRCPSAMQPPLKREYADLDLVCARGGQAKLGACLERIGYQADKRFNAIHGKQQLYFGDPTSGLHIDVFVGVIKMCHTIDVSQRLELLPDTLTPSDLLLTKLQIVEINPKDLLDLLAMAHDQRVEAGRADALDSAYLGELWGSDWPLWRTSRQTLLHVRDAAAVTLGHAASERALGTIAALEEILEICVKSRRWRLRALVGERVRWYELPDEINA